MSTDTPTLRTWKRMVFDGTVYVEDTCREDLQRDLLLVRELSENQASAIKWAKEEIAALKESVESGPRVLREDAERNAARAERAEYENAELRIMCAIAVTGLGKLYHDDGELQDTNAQPWIDWKRDSVDEIQRKLRERNKETLSQIAKMQSAP